VSGRLGALDRFEPPAKIRHLVGKARLADLAEPLIERELECACLLRSEPQLDRP
jgi:hypothetical protein